MWKCAACGENVDDSFEVCWSCGTSVDGKTDPAFFDAAIEPAPENVPLEDVTEDMEEPEPMVTVARCALTVEAYAIRLHLEEAGIPVFLADEFTVVMDWLLSNAIGGIKVQVPESYAEKAQERLANFSPRRETVEEEGEET